MATRTTTRKSAPKTTRKPAAKAQPDAQPQTDDNPKLAALQADAEHARGGLTVAQRKALATKILKMKTDGVPWDRPETGICAVLGLANALQGRAILREFGHGAAIKPLTGLRAPQAS